MIVLIAWVVVAQSIELYQAKNRPAAELVPIAESALGSEGQVTLDVRTATLVLNGSPESVRRALALLERLDRPLREVVLDTAVSEDVDLEALGVRVAWKTSLGPVRIGTVPFGPDRLSVGVETSRVDETTTSRSRLRLTEGAPGVIATGEALPVLFATYWAATTTYLPVETGFEATARVIDDDRVHLELRPFAGRVDETGELRYIAAASSLTVAPGETVVLAETTQEVESATRDLSGAERTTARGQQIVLVSVELER